jgi:hypothetical protein
MKVFISHINEEAPLAHVLKEWVESSFLGQAEVFVSSDIRDLPAGKKWLDEIDTALQGAQLFLVLCSPYSLPRPWINFETGCAWIKRIPILPLCHSGQAKGLLPSPISEFQALEVEDPSFIEKFLHSVAKHLTIGRVPRIDQRLMRGDIAYALAQIAKGSSLSAATPSPASSLAYDLYPEAVAFLTRIAEVGGFIHLDTVENLAAVLNIPEINMEYYLDPLLERGLVEKGIAFLWLTANGRRFLVERGLPDPSWRPQRVLGR